MHAYFFTIILSEETVTYRHNSHILSNWILTQMESKLFVITHQQRCFIGTLGALKYSTACKVVQMSSTLTQQ